MSNNVKCSAVYAVLAKVEPRGRNVAVLDFGTTDCLIRRSRVQILLCRQASSDGFARIHVAASRALLIFGEQHEICCWAMDQSGASLDGQIVTAEPRGTSVA